MLEAAARLIAERGYTATTIKDIAETAGVSPATVYHHFTDKGTILVRLLEADETDLARKRDLWVLDVIASPTAAEHLRRQTDHIGREFARCGLLLAAARAAASDPQVAGVWSTIRDRREENRGLMLAALTLKPGYRSEIPASRAGDVIDALLNVTTFDYLVRRGWSQIEWQDFVADLLVHRLTMP